LLATVGSVDTTTSLASYAKDVFLIRVSRLRQKKP